MGIFGGRLWPYTNLHGINLDYLIEKVASLDSEIEESRTLLEQAQETAAQIDEQLEEVRQLVADAQESVDDSRDALERANALLMQIEAELEAIRFKHGEALNTAMAEDPQLCTVKVRFGQIGGSDISPEITQQTTQLVTWGDFMSLDTTPEIYNACKVGRYSTDKALIFPVMPETSDYYNVALWNFYYTIDNTIYYQAPVIARNIPYFGTGIYLTVLFPDDAIAWSATAQNNTGITEENKLPNLTGKWIHKSLYYNEAVSFTPQYPVPFIADAEKYSYFAMTINIDHDVASNLEIRNFGGSGKITIRQNNDHVISGRIIITENEPEVEITGQNYTPAAAFIIGDNLTASQFYLRASKVTLSNFYMSSTASVTAISIARATLTISNIDLKGYLNAISIDANTLVNSVTIIGDGRFTGNVTNIINPGSLVSEAMFYIPGPGPSLPESVNDQATIIDDIETNSLLFTGEGRSVTFVASRQA